MRDDTDGVQSSGQGRPWDRSRWGSDSSLTFKEFLAKRLMEAWFANSKPIGPDLENWLEIADQDSDTVIDAMHEYRTMMTEMGSHEPECLVPWIRECICWELRACRDRVRAEYHCKLSYDHALVTAVNAIEGLREELRNNSKS